jgi:predicted AAA+ superfamily ATPase
VVTVGKVNDREIDFVCEKAGKCLYLQVAYLLASEETIARAFGVFDHVDDHYPKYVLSMDEMDMSRNGIRHCNVREFLLSDQSD